jgi:HSP20 family protein
MDLFSHAAREFAEARWQPAADVYRMDHGWLVKLEVAGIQPEQIQIHIEGQAMTIRGRRMDHQLKTNACCHRLEIAYCRFERRLEFPIELRQADITTEYRDGMLLIQILTGSPADE